MYSHRPAVRSRTALFAVLVTVASLMVPAGPAAAETPTAAPVTATVPTGTVTLITGDRVTLDTSGGSPVTVVEPEGGERTGATFTTLTQDGDAYVIPDDVAHLVPDVLELDLFNVSALVEMGYGDAETDTLPLIVRGGNTARALGAAARALPSIDATAVELPKDAADDFVDTLTAGTRAAGVSRVWLDRPVQASELDWNLDAIGAPTAWQSGLTGAGVDVAVLDTGVDDSHPDLTGKLAAEANFTDEATADDGTGHGTHVASVVGGTGAAANGARKGVAFDARLLSGKVLDSEGEGQQSWVINGMEWAAAQGADVVNMSLGGRASEAGDDPVVEALERLTEENGTLFVVAAGNFGPGPGTIDSPGVAESALTVGNANANGHPVRNSGNGPTKGTYRTKPDLSAPGVGIVGARAGGGEPYVAMTGTSMATPHVAGAAALLRQQHPDWSWRDIKNTLMTTADAKVSFPAPNSEGAGLLDLPGATTETLRYDRSNVDFQFRRWPEGQQRASVQVTITNTGSEPESLSFTDTAKNHWNEQAPETMFTVEPSELTIEPGASGTVTTTLDPSVGTPGIYGGLVTVARQGKESTTLPLNATVEAPRRDVHLTVLDRRGEPWAGGTVWLGNVDKLAQRYGGGYVTEQLDQNGQVTARVAPGPISMIARVETPAHGDEPASVSLAGYSEVMVDTDVTVTIDARKALPVRPATVAGASTSVQRLAMHYVHRDAADAGSIGSIVYAPGADVENGGVFVEPTDPVRTGRSLFQTHWRLEADEHRRPGQADAYEVLLDSPTIPDPPAFHVTARQVRQMARLVQDYRTVGQDKADFLELRYAATPLVSAPLGFWRARQAPAKAVELVTARPDVRWSHRVAGQVQLATHRNVYQPGQRVTRSWFAGMAPAVLAASQSHRSLHLPVDLSDGQHLGNGNGTSSARLFREGVEVPRRGSNYFDVPAEAATYRLEHTGTPDQEILPYAARTETAWTFSSAAPADPSRFSQPAQLLNIGYEPNTDDTGHLRAWRPLTVQVGLSTTVGNSGPVVGERGTLRFWTSTDHGEHWVASIAIPMPDGTFAVIAPMLPRPGDVVSIRATATGADGRATTQTLVDAYPVR